MTEGKDLFGQVAVTWPEVYAWCEAVAGIPADSPRLAHYVRGYDVAGKVAQAKLAGTFHTITHRQPPPAHWWARFRWH
jgi:hypothetical protein